MALSGLPKTGRIGFELFDRTNLGVTEFAEHINYQRALEGELERSVMSLAEVEQARVHITLAKDSVFTQSREPAKASVLLKLRPGVTLAPRSVAGDQPSGRRRRRRPLPAGRLRGRHGRQPAEPPHSATGCRHGANPPTPSSNTSSRSRRAWPTRSTPRSSRCWGAGRFRAGSRSSAISRTSEQSEELFNPEQSVVTSSHVTEESTGGAEAAPARGIPGTASALPRPAARAGPAGTGVSRRSENTTYQASRTVRRTSRLRRET